MLEVAHQRLPACDVRLADLEALPFESSTFDAVVVARGESPCAMVYPNTDVAWLAHASAAPTQAAIRIYGEDAVRRVLAEVDARHARADGTICFENVFVWAAGERG